MKQRSTTPVSTGLATRSLIVAVAVVATISAPLAVTTQVLARDYDAEINAIQGQIDQFNAQAGALGVQAQTLEAELQRLASEKAVIQNQIDLSQTKLAKLRDDIEVTKQKIAMNKDALGKTIANMYVDDKISPLEMLASSKNIGEYVDKQEYRSSVRDELNTTIDTINKLKKQLEDQRIGVERELKNQESQRAQLAAKEAEQNQLLEKTRGEEAAYTQLANAKNKEASDLRAAQAEENRKAAAAAMASKSGGGYSGSIPAGTPGGGGYPGTWANAPVDAYIDPWGLYTRECVSYVAWKINSTGRFVPHFAGAGNANQWPSTAARFGISSGSQPRAGAAAVMMIGYYGHVMYVESVNGDGTITVSDYNLNFDGLYRHYTRSASGLTYVYF